MIMKQNSSRKTVFTTSLNPETRDRLKDWCYETGYPANRLLEHLLLQFLDNLSAQEEVKNLFELTDTSPEKFYSDTSPEIKEE